MKNVKTKSRGAPSKYETHVKSRFDEIKEWLELGATEKEIYTNLGISKDSWIDYKKKYTELFDLIKNSRKNPVIQIKKAMLKRAVGFQYEEKKVVTQSIKFDDERLGEIPAKVIRTEVTTKTALPDPGAGLILLQHWDLNDDGSTKWSRDPANRELKKEELEFKKKQIEEEW